MRCQTGGLGLPLTASIIEEDMLLERNWQKHCTLYFIHNWS